MNSRLSNSRFPRRSRLTVPAMMSMLETIRDEAATDIALGDFAETVSLALEQLDLLRSVAKQAMFEAELPIDDDDLEHTFMARVVKPRLS